MSSMRGSNAESLLAILLRILEDQVLQTVTAPSGRSAIQLVAGILDNLAPRVEEKAHLRSLDRDLALGLLRSVPPYVAGEVRRQPASEDPSRQLSFVLRALTSRSDTLADPAVTEWLSTCRAALKRRNEIEVAMMRPTRYLASAPTSYGRYSRSANSASWR